MPSNSPSDRPLDLDLSARDADEYYDTVRNVHFRSSGTYDIPPNSVDRYLRAECWSDPQTFDSEDTDRESADDTTDPEFDIMDDEPAEAAADAADPDPLTELNGIGDTRAQFLRSGGFETVEQTRDATVEQLIVVDGISNDLAASLSEADDE